MSVCIGVVHATRVAVSPIEAAFEKHWPNAETIQLLDESLARDLDAIGHLTPAIFERVGRLAKFAQRGGAAAILFSCSAFGPAIEAVQERLPLPVLKPNQAMLDEALTQGGRVHILSTFRASGPAMRGELEALATRKKVDLEIEESCVPDALDALHAGDPDTHDALIAEAAAGSTRADVVLLAQFSMARALDAVSRRVDTRVLSSPESAVLALKRMMRAPANGHGPAQHRVSPLPGQ